MSLRPRSTWAFGVLASATPFVLLGCWFPWVTVSTYHQGPVPWSGLGQAHTGFGVLDWAVLAGLAVGWVGLLTASTERRELLAAAATGLLVAGPVWLWARDGELDALYPTGEAIFVPGPGFHLLVATAGYLLLGGLLGLLAGDEEVRPADLREDRAASAGEETRA